VKKSKGDVELSRQMKAAGGSGRVEAVLRMHDPPERDAAAVPARTRARRLVRRVERETGLKAEDLHVFEHLAAFVVCGPAALVRALMDLDEVASAVANRRPAPLATPVPVPVARRKPATKRPARRKGA
jgi:hypothetical protein